LWKATKEAPKKPDWKKFFVGKTIAFYVAFVYNDHANVGFFVKSEGK